MSPTYFKYSAQSAYRKYSIATILPTKDFRMRHKSNRIHNEDWEPKDTVEEVTEGEVQHEHGGAVPEVRVVFLVSIFRYISALKILQFLPNSADTNGDDSEKVSKSSDGNDQSNVDVNIFLPNIFR